MWTYIGIFVAIIYIIIYIYYKKEKFIKKDLINWLQYFKNWYKYSKVVNGLVQYISFPMIIIVSICVTIICYNKNILILYTPKSSVSDVYEFIWTVIMVFSVDAAVSQLLQKKFNISKRNCYLGVSTLSYLDSGYIIIHKFIRSKSFGMLLLYFVIMPLFIFGKDTSLDSSLLLYFWQTDYMVISLILLSLITSDFKMPHYLQLINNHKDSSSIKSYITYACHNKLIKEINNINNNENNEFIVNYIEKQFEKIWKIKRNKNIAKNEECELICIVSRVVFNRKIYFKYGNLYITYLYNFIRSYMNKLPIWLYKINSSCNKVKNKLKIYRCIIEKYSDLIDSSLSKSFKHNNDISIQVDFLPYKIINKEYICNDIIWQDIINLFQDNNFIRISLSGAPVNLNSFKYKPVGYSKMSYELIQINIIKLIVTEMPYLYSQYRSKDFQSKENFYNNLDSLKNIFPQFFKEYVNTSYFEDKINYASISFLRAIHENVNVKK